MGSNVKQLYCCAYYKEVVLPVGSPNSRLTVKGNHKDEQTPVENRNRQA